MQLCFTGLSFPSANKKTKLKKNPKYISYLSQYKTVEKNNSKMLEYIYIIKA